MWPRRLSKPDCHESNELRQAREAATSAAEERRRVEEQAVDARGLGEAIRTALEHNHFGESIQRAFLRRRPTT